MAKAAVIELNDEERQRLESVARARTGKRQEVQRARVILLAAQGVGNRQIGREVGLHYNAVGQTRARFVQERLGALRDRPRSGTGRAAGASPRSPRRSKAGLSVR